MTINDRIISTIRTLVPALWGVAIAWIITRIPAVQDVLTWLSDTLGTDATNAIGWLLTALVIAGYYWLARKLTARFPALEKILIGSSLVPTYIDARDTNKTTSL